MLSQVGECQYFTPAVSAHRPLPVTGREECQWFLMGCLVGTFSFIVLMALFPRASYNSGCTCSVWPCLGYLYGQDSLYLTVNIIWAANYKAKALTLDRGGNCSSQGLQAPVDLQNHSTRGLTITCPAFKGVSIQDICAAASWHTGFMLVGAWDKLLWEYVNTHRETKRMNAMYAVCDAKAYLKCPDTVRKPHAKRL